MGKQLYTLLLQNMMLGNNVNQLARHFPGPFSNPTPQLPPSNEPTD